MVEIGYNHHCLEHGILVDIPKNVHLEANAIVWFTLKVTNTGQIKPDRGKEGAGVEDFYLFAVCTSSPRFKAF